MTDVYAAPHVEDQEMGKIREIFDRALNAMVDATTLAKSVEQLRTDLDSLKTQVTHYRNTIANQDDQITRLRQERDAARTAQYHAEDASRHLTTDYDSVKREVENLSLANVRLNDRISELTKERDDSQFKLLELQEAHNALMEKMDKVVALFTPAKSEPLSTVSPVKEPEPIYHSDNVTTIPVVPVSEPEPPTNPPEPSPASWPGDIR